MSIRTVQSSAMAFRHTAVSARSNQGVVTPWVRNPSWVALPTVGPTDQKFVGLIAVFPDSNFAALSATTDTGTYTVNWGDGTSAQTYTSGAQANYQYAYSASGLTDTPVTFTAATSTVNRTSHGYTNGMTISFNTVVTTTGIVAGQIYYVVNATTNTFQVSAASGGSAITLTNDGSGTILPYKMAVVVVTATTGNLTGLNLNLRNTQTGLNKYETGWLDIAVGSPNFTASGLQLSSSTSGSSSIYMELVQQVTIVNLGNQNTAAYLFYGMSDLRNLVMTASTSAVTSAVNMFGACYSLQTTPLFDTSAVTTMSNMFYECYSLQAVPLFNTTNVTVMTNMFYLCYSLQSVPLFNTVNVVGMSFMFYFCSSLQTVPLFNTVAVTSMGSMFYGCYSLQLAPLLNTVAVLNMSSMFNSCYSLQSVPLFNTSAATNMASMFQNCTSLQSVPLFNTASATNMGSLFQGCTSLQSVPLFNTASVTSMSSMFQNCSSILSVPLFNTASVTTMASMFSGCSSLLSVPLFNTAAVTSMNSMFVSCPSLLSVPLFNTAAVTTVSLMFNACSSLNSVPALNFTGVTTGNFSSLFSSCANLATILAYNWKFSFSITSCKLSQTAIETVFQNLFSTTGQTITVGSGTNWGAPAVISLSGTTTSGSTTVTMASTTGLSVGMEIAGTGISTSRAVTLQTTANTVTLNNHGIPNGTLVSFATIVTTTGIVVYTPYYVVNATTNTFQVSLTSGGSAITLTNNGSGTILYGTTITAITPNTNVTLSIPASASNAITTTSALLHRSYATLRGWTVA